MSDSILTLGYLYAYAKRKRELMVMIPLFYCGCYSDIKVTLPFSVQSSNTNTTYSYLDTSGRPTITLHNTACSEIHAQDVIVSYKFTSLDLVQKPAAVAGIALIAFVVLGLSRKVSWTIKG